jgi:hypothetical protein
VAGGQFRVQERRPVRRREFTRHLGDGAIHEAQRL